MEFRLQHFLLSLSATFFLFSHASAIAAGKKLDLNNEFFEFGVSGGVINIQDFTSEPTVVLTATFNATEDFFLQYNYQFADVSLSSFEAGPDRDSFFEGESRSYTHYDVLLGYKFFQSEFFIADGYTTIGNLYTVIGAGNNSFGGEDAFATVVGIGYKVGLNRRWNLRTDFKDYIYKSGIFADQRTTHNTSFTVGLSFLW